MTSIRNLPIRKKIVAIIMIISAAALVLTSTALIAYDFVTARRDLRVSATTLARIIADNTTAAVSFNDSPAAHDTLESLRAEASIVAACVYVPSGLFASFVAPGHEDCPSGPASQSFETGYISVSSPIELNGKELGTVILRATLAPAYARLRLKVVTVAVILLFSALFALILSSRLQRLVSEPILSLAAMAKAVSLRKDYSIRATKQSEDELGALVDAFNEMLSEIALRDSELQNRTTELIQANRMKDEFLATLSHELRTPLNSIMGWAVLIKAGELTPAREKSGLEAIERNARIQARLIEDLLDVSRIISGKFTMDAADVGLKRIIEGAIEVVRPAAEAKQIRIQFENDSETVQLVGDGARLQQAVWNLLSNAVKFTGEHGVVNIRLQKVESHARISVSDNGAGITAEFLPYVFDRFRQADGSSTRTHAGLGLGLAIVRHIVEMHGGTISAHSQGPGRGATFTIDLPLPDSLRNSGKGGAGEAETDNTHRSA